MNFTRRIGFLFVGIFFATCANSHGGATGIVKERMDAMQDMGDRSKVVANMFKGVTEFDPEQITLAARVFKKHALTMSTLFPDSKHSRAGSDTEALATIWEDWEEFNSMIIEFAEQSDVLIKIAGQTDDKKILKAEFFKTTKNCSACHKKFRAAKG